MTQKEAPPGRRAPQSERADGGGVNRNRRSANPEKSGGAKLLGCGVYLAASQGALC